MMVTIVNIRVLCHVLDQLNFNQVFFFFLYCLFASRWEIFLVLKLRWLNACRRINLLTAKEKEDNGANYNDKINM